MYIDLTGNGMIFYDSKYRDLFPLPSVCVCVDMYFLVSMCVMCKRLAGQTVKLFALSANVCVRERREIVCVR